jgi:hypothetical protein
MFRVSFSSTCAGASACSGVVAGQRCPLAAQAQCAAVSLQQQLCNLVVSAQKHALYGANGFELPKHL